MRGAGIRAHRDRSGQRDAVLEVPAHGFERRDIGVGGDVGEVHNDGGERRFGAGGASGSESENDEKPTHGEPGLGIRPR